MHMKTLLAATATIALMGGGAALAQQPAPTPGSATGDWNGAHAPSDKKQYETTTTVTTTTPAPLAETTTTTETTTIDSTTATSATTSASPASFTTTMVTNGPVPDTAENRAKYGQPMSRAGKRTAARGN
jgi:hypothetical protein